MRLRSVTKFGLCLAALGTGVVSGHQFEWRTATVCPSWCWPPCPAHCTDSSCRWESEGVWALTVCEAPPYCEQCAYTAFPDDAGDDGIIKDVGEKTIELGNFTIDVLMVQAVNVTTDIVFESATTGNVLTVDSLIIQAGDHDPQAPFVDVTLTIRDGARIVSQ